jgi:mannosyltransferase
MIGPQQVRRLPLRAVAVTNTQATAPPAEPEGDPTRSPAHRWVVAAWIAVGVAVAIGVVLRFWTQSHLWLDEALSVNIAKLPVGDIPEALRHDGHPPLYYWLLHGWMSVFGESDRAVRALSGVFAVLALPLMWLAGRRVGGRTVAWLAVVLLALNPWAFRYATEARMYSMVVVLVLAGYLCVMNALEDDGIGWLVGVALLTGTLLLTHYWALYLVAATVVLLALRLRSPVTRRRAVHVLIAVAVGGLAFVPWLPSFVYQAGHTGSPWAKPIRPPAIFTITANDLGGIGAEGQIVGFILTVLVLLALFGVARDRRHIDLDLRTVPQVRTELAVTALTLGFGIAAVFVTSGTYESRYAAVFVPFLLLAAAAGLTRFLADWLRLTIVALLVLGGLLGGYRNVTVERTQLGAEVVPAINASAKPGDIVLYCPDQLGPAGTRHLRGDVVTLAYPTLGSPERVDWVDYADRNAAADPDAIAQEVLKRAGDHTIWYAWAGTYRTFEGQCEAVNSALLRARPQGVARVTDNGNKYFEHAWLFEFPPST